MHFDIHPFLEVAFRSTVVYGFMIIAFRIFGKRELSQLSIADLVLIVPFRMPWWAKIPLSWAD
jgi:uncharacterized membrane protein YcaP (DUF421 family)